jgi:hypothetical protein
MKVSGWIAGFLLVSAYVCTGTAQSLVSTGANAAHGAQAIASVSERIVREIRDPHTGTRWLVLKSTQNSGGPGRAVTVADPAWKAVQRAAPEIVIRPGDKVVVEEHTAAVDGRFEAMALAAAASGCQFDARLKIGGRVVRAVALAPGRAILAPSGEVRP